MAKEHNDKQAAAWLTSVIIVTAFTIYWVAQIQSVREMLALAYG
jgi:Na+/proline symporter